MLRNGCSAVPSSIEQSAATVSVEIILLALFKSLANFAASRQIADTNVSRRCGTDRWHRLFSVASWTVYEKKVSGSLPLQFAPLIADSDLNFHNRMQLP